MDAASESAGDARALERERDSAANGASLASRSFQKAEESSEQAAEKGDAFFFPSLRESLHFFSPLWKAWSEPSLVLWYSRLSLLSPHSPAASPSCGLALELKLPPPSLCAERREERGLRRKEERRRPLRTRRTRALFSLCPPNNHAEPRSPEAASAAADGRLASQRYGEEDEAGPLARARALALFLFNRR